MTYTPRSKRSELKSTMAKLPLEGMVEIRILQRGGGVGGVIMLNEDATDWIAWRTAKSLFEDLSNKLVYARKMSEPFRLSRKK